jgi:hypothetical protein
MGTVAIFSVPQSTSHSYRVKVVTMMERQLHQLVRLVDDLLYCSRISRGAVQERRRGRSPAKRARNRRSRIRGSRHEAQRVLGAYVEGRRELEAKLRSPS